MKPAFVLVLLLTGLLGQDPPKPGEGKRDTPKDYVLGPDDQISILAPDVEEISGKPFRVDQRGEIRLPLVGRLQAAGLTSDQVEVEIKRRLRKYLQDPDVIVSVAEYRSQPISVLGSVQSPGVHQLQGHKSLFEVLSLAGGLRLDAGYSIKITRKLEWGRIPLPGAHDDPTGQFSIASVRIKSILAAVSPEENIEIKPQDVISVPKADMIYVIGSIARPGGYVLDQNETLSALQVLSLAGGHIRFAALDRARIMRVVPGNATRVEIPLDLKKLMAGKGPDVPLKADDILFVPNSAGKAATVRGIEAALGMGTSIGTGLAVYR